MAHDTRAPMPMPVRTIGEMATSYIINHAHGQGMRRDIPSACARSNILLTTAGHVSSFFCAKCKLWNVTRVDLGLEHVVLKRRVVAAHNREWRSHSVKVWLPEALHGGHHGRRRLVLLVELDGEHAQRRVGGSSVDLPSRLCTGREPPSRPVAARGRLVSSGLCRVQRWRMGRPARGGGEART